MQGIKNTLTIDVLCFIMLMTIYHSFTIFNTPGSVNGLEKKRRKKTPKTAMCKGGAHKRMRNISSLYVL